MSDNSRRLLVTLGLSKTAYSSKTCMAIDISKHSPAPIEAILKQLAQQSKR